MANKTRIQIKEISISVLITIMFLTNGCIDNITEAGDVNYNTTTGNIEYIGTDINSLTFGHTTITTDGNINTNCITLSDGNKMCGLLDMNGLTGPAGPQGPAGLDGNSYTDSNTLAVINGLDLNNSLSYSKVDTNFQTAGLSVADINNLWRANGTSIYYNDGNVGIGTSTSDRANAFTILKDGNTGIGTATPQNKLNVTGDINATGNIYGTNIYSNAQPVITIEQSDTNLANYTYTKTQQDTNWGKYLPLAGGTMTGDITMTNKNIVDANSLIVKNGSSTSTIDNNGSCMRITSGSTTVFIGC